MENKIAGKVVVVTGASSGAGKTIALSLARRQANLVLASRNLTALEKAVSECKALGADAIAIATDVTDLDAIAALVSSAIAWKGQVDVWVNNAGVLAAGAFDETPWEVQEQVININLLGYMRCAYAILPHFKQRGTGILINNISIGGFLPVPYGTAYSAAKFGLRGCFEAMKGELADFKKIHIVDLFPAFIDTPGILHAANYTGKKLKPVPPVADPAIVARAVVASIVHPKATRYPGGISLLFKLAHALAPDLLVKLTGLIMRDYFKTAKAAPRSSGNVVATVDQQMGTHGNGKGRLDKTPQTITLAGAVALATVLAMKLFSRNAKVR